MFVRITQLLLLCLTISGALSAAESAPPVADTEFDGWTFDAAASDAGKLEYGNFNGREKVWKTCPVKQGTPFKWLKTAALPAGQSASLHLEVSAMPPDYATPQWLLNVVVNGKSIFKKNRIEHANWQSFDVDLSAYAGQSINLELWNGDNGSWHWVVAYWSNVSIKITGGVQPQAAPQAPPAPSSRVLALAGMAPNPAPSAAPGPRRRRAAGRLERR